MGSESNDCVFVRGEDTQRHRERVMGRQEQSLGCCSYNPRGIKDCQEPPKARRDSSLEPQMGAWPCQHFGCGLLASRTDTFLLFLNHPICENLLQQP